MTAGAYTEVISVGAVDCENKLALFSRKGEAVDIVAPGVDVLTSASTSGPRRPTRLSHIAFRADVKLAGTKPYSLDFMSWAGPAKVVTEPSLTAEMAGRLALLQKATPAWFNGVSTSWRHKCVHPQLAIGAC